MGKTGFFFDEKCFWHAGGNYALTVPVGELVEPLSSGGLPENPETKRRLKNLIEVTGLIKELDACSSPLASFEELRTVHPESYLRKFKELSDHGGGEMGLRVPFGPGGFEIASQSAGLVIEATKSVLLGKIKNAYALSRPPGHHCLPDFPNGFCLLNNIAIAIEVCKKELGVGKILVLDWDVHHGNGTEQIFYQRNDVYAISIHQERNYPLNTGNFEDRGAGLGEGFNLNIPLPPGTGHQNYIEAVEKLILPEIKKYSPDIIIVACGYDASGVDPLSRMMCYADTFKEMTRRVMEAANIFCDDRIVFAHEGGYSEVHVPFCGHAVIQELSSSYIDAGDVLKERISSQQPNNSFIKFVSKYIDQLKRVLR